MPNNSLLASIAVSFAWETESKSKGNNGTELFQKIKKAVAPNDTVFMSCDRCVATAVLQSGADDNYPLGNTANQYNHMKAHPELWQVVGKLVNNMNALMPGDIINVPTNSQRMGHTLMYVGNELVKQKFPNSDAVIVSASYGERSPGCGSNLSWYANSDSRRDGYEIFRYIGNYGGSLAGSYEGGANGYIGTTSAYDYTYNDYDTRATLVDSVPFHPDTVIGRRLSSIIKQPVKSYCNIYIGDKLLTTDPSKPNYLQSMTVDRLDGTTGATFTFTVFDQNWEEIEKIFSDYYTDVHIQYGYVDSKLVSPMYDCQLLNYSISFNSKGVILDVQAISIGTGGSNITSGVSFKQMSIDTKTKNPTEAAKIICRAAGYEVLDENFEATQDVSENFVMLNDIAASYINDIIISSAISMNGESMNFNVVNNVAYFRAESFRLPANTVDSYNMVEEENADDSKIILKTYIYMKGQDSVVEDLTFDIKGVFGGTTMYRVASGLTTTFIDPMTKETGEVTETVASVVEQTTTTGENQCITSDQSIPNVNSAGATKEEVQTELRSNLLRSVTRMYQATMTIVGDPTINMLDNIRIINVTEDGHLHHTSGIYLVLGVVDNIDGGSMKTTLKLLRNGNINEGIAVTNPREIVK